MRVLEGASRKIAGHAHVIGLAAAILAGCGSSARSGLENTGGAGGQTQGTSTRSSASSASGIVLTGTGVGTGTGAGGSVSVPMSWVTADVGAYEHGAPVMGDSVSDTGVSSANGCTVLVGIVRDFKGSNEPGGHPDFEAFSGSAQTPGLVQDTLGGDGKPVYAGHCATPDVTADCPYGQQMTSQADYDPWYRYTAGVNLPYLLYLELAQDPTTKVATFASSLFFPLDGVGYGNSGTGDDNRPHNFGFTTEIHTKFLYSGGEHFTFTGDDDLWVFINQKLAIDLGGLHPPATQTVDLDASAQTLGLTKGNVYALELFNAERHTTGSNFRVDTDLGFVDCGSFPPPK